MLKVKQEIKKAISELNKINDNLEKAYLIPYNEIVKVIDQLEVKEETTGLNIAVDFAEIRYNAFASCIENSELQEDIECAIAIIINYLEEFLYANEDSETEEVEIANEIMEQVQEIFDGITFDECEEVGNIEDIIEDLILNLNRIKV